MDSKCDIIRKSVYKGKDMRKVLIIGYSNIWGGIEKFICDILDGVDRRKISIDLLIYKVLSSDQEYNLKQKGVGIYYVPQIGKAPFSFLVEIFRFYKSHHYDMIHIHSSHAISIMYVMPVWLHKTGIIFHSHNMAGNTQILHRICRKIVERRSNIKLACSKKAAYYMYETLENVEIIPNGINVELYTYRDDIRKKERAVLGITESMIVLGNVCRFVPEKNLFFLIDIFDEFRKIRQNAQLLLIGTGSLKEGLEKYIKEKGLTRHVVMPGMVSNPQDWYNVMDVLVMPSMYEGFPYVGIEAQTNDLPVFFSDQITQEIEITDRAFFLSLAEGAQYWAKEINCWLEQGLRERRDNRELIKNAGYELGTAARRMEEIYLSDI